MTAAEVWWLATGQLTGASMQPYIRVLSALERRRASKYHFDHDRRDYIAAHCLLRWSLSEWYGIPPSEWKFDVSKLGKPRVNTSGGCTVAEFSISHTRGLVAVVLGQTAVGIDVEWTGRRTDPSLADGLFATEEIAELNALPDDTRQQRFLELWTLKECYVKAIGAGLNHPLDSYYFTRESDETRIHWKQPQQDERDWQFIQKRPTSEHVMAVAVPANSQRGRPAPSDRFQSDASFSKNLAADIRLHEVTLADWNSLR